MLLLTALVVLAAIGATTADMQPSALRVMVTAVVGLLAPLFWPGLGATPARTALRIAAWSVAAAALAALALRILGNPAQTFARILGPCMVLMLILLLAHAAAAGLEVRFRGRTGDAQCAREMAGRTVALLLALLGSLPLWLGPAGELLSGRHAWIIDAIVGISPLTHLAIASDNDLLRNEWLYQHSNLAALQLSYPGLAELTWSYVSVCLMLGVIALAFRQPGRRSVDATPTLSTTEKTS